MRDYTTTQLSRLANVTLRQLQWWDEKDVVRARTRPLGSGGMRLWDTYDAAEVLVIAELRRRGLSLQWIRKTLSTIRKSHTYLLTKEYMVVSQRGVRFGNAEKVCAWCATSKLSVHVIDISFLMNPIRDDNEASVGAPRRLSGSAGYHRTDVSRRETE